jgi:HAD superfamily hydrolase (TIGR01484 family)
MTTARFKNKDLIVFDLDGTLTPSKSDMEPDMAQALVALLAQKKVAVIGGGGWPQFKKQFLAKLACPKELRQNLFLFPTTAMAFYRYQKGWQTVYRKSFSTQEIRKIRAAFRTTFTETGYRVPKKIWGVTIENRHTQMSFSALGQKAPLREKEKWNKTNDVRPQLMAVLKKLIPECEVRSGGLTTIDVTQKGIDKAYGIRQIEKNLHVPIRNMLFVGDALYPGGNDAAAKKTGVRCIAVRGQKDTKRIIKEILGVM